VPEQPAPIFIGALTPGIKQKATSVRLSNPSYGLLESGNVGQQKSDITSYVLITQAVEGRTHACAMKKYIRRPSLNHANQELILRLLNLQLQRQRRSRLERFLKVEGSAGYSWRCKFLKRWLCKSHSWDWDRVM
jgi:hypothetical protein